MSFPDDPEMAQSWYRLHERPFVIESLRKHVPGPINLSQHDFDVLAQDFRDMPNDQELQKRRSSGWVLGALFHFILSGRGFRPPSLSEDEAKSYYTTIRKAPLHLEYLAKLGDGCVPGTQIKRRISEETISRARARQWNSAHYWAAMYNERGDLRYPEPRSDSDWLSFMHLAETLGALGIGRGVFRKLAPARLYDEAKIIGDSRFEPYKRVIMPALSQQARDELLDYRSRTADLKHNTPGGK